MIAAVDFSGVSIPFGVSDMLTTAVNFLSIFSEWEILAVAVTFSVILVALVYYFVNKAQPVNESDMIPKGSGVELREMEVVFRKQADGTYKREEIITTRRL